MTERITSRNNPKIKNISKLAASASYRRESSLFVAEGVRLCSDAQKSGVEMKELYITEKAEKKYYRELEKSVLSAENVYIITDEVADRIADTKNTQGVFSVCRILDKKLFTDKIKKDGIYIATDNIQTPDNLGAICRTAEALGINGLIIGSGCDMYNPKALRASMGAFFRLPVLVCDNLAEELSALRKTDMKVLASVPDSNAVKITQLGNKKGTVCVIGNEGNGISDEILGISDLKVTIPMLGRAESLNAAAAASIIMWELVKF